MGSTVIFQRGLPNDGPYVNGNPNPDRSNVDWVSGQTDVGNSWDILGDDFSFGGQSIVDSITVYAVANTACATSACSGVPSDLSAELSSISLYLGPQQGTLTFQTTVSSVSQVFYAPNASYQDTAGSSYFPVYALTFNLPAPLMLGAGVKESFAVDATPIGNSSLVLAAVNAGNAALSGAREDGADNAFIVYQETIMGASTATYFPLASGGAGDPTPGFCDTDPNTTNACAGAWDKGSDLAVTITGTTAPEPGTICLSVVGMLALGLRLRRR